MPTMREAFRNLSLKTLTEVTRLDVSDPTIKNFIDKVHEGIAWRARSLSNRDNDRYVFESRIFRLLCGDKNLTALRIVERLREIYGYDVTADEVLRAFRYNSIATPDERRKIFGWAAAAVDAFVKVLLTKNESDHENCRRIQSHNESFGVKHKLFCLTLYEKYPELDFYGDLKKLEKFGDAYMKHLRADMNYFLKEICSSPTKNKNQSAEQIKISQLENALKRNEMLLKDLQDDFEARLEENHQNEMTDFFSRLNSEKYGCILDAIINVRDGVKKLRRQNVDLPPEISGLFILVDNLTKFVRDHEINPIMKLGSIHALKFSEIETCDYEGTPYLDAEDVKRVKVLSPGWFYKNRDIQIARPRLKEIADDE